MGLFYCVQAGCAEVRYKPYRPDGGIRYRYPNEDCCEDLCTAAKCQELEGRIDKLQQLIFELTGLVQEHRNLPVPYAHDIIPNFNVVTKLNGADLTTKVDLFGERQESTVTLPDSIVPSVTFDIFDLENGSYVFKVGINGVTDEDTFTVAEPYLDFVITELSPGEFDFEISTESQLIAQTLNVTLPENSEQIANDIDFNVDVSYRFNLLTVAVTIDGITKKDTIYIDADVINRFGGGGSNTNTGDSDVGCQQIADALQLELGEILAAIAAVEAKVTQVKEVVTVEVDAYALAEFDCPEENGGDGAENNAAQVKDYKLATLPAIHKQLKYMNENQLAMFENICRGGGVLAFPDWWQVRLGSNVPQVVCSFRKGDTSTYHSLSIPHPKDTDKPKQSLLPSYTKGNWQGMVTCKDNSKFIINCVNAGEAAVMCDVAISLIDPEYLESPPRVYIGERKGQAVGVDVMIPAVIQYFESGQQNFVPNWRIRVAELDSQQ